MKRPLILATIWYAGGIVLGELLSLPPLTLWAVSMAVAVAALAWSRARLLLLGPLLLLAGGTNQTFRTVILSPHDLRVVIGEETEDLVLSGTLAETPSQRVYLHDQKESWHTMARLQVESVKSAKGSWRPAFGQLAATTPGVLSDEFFAGRKVEVTGVLRPPRGPLAEGLFDYRTYLRRQGIYYELRVGATNDWTILPGMPLAPPVAVRFTVWAKRILSLGLPEADEPLQLLWAMTLGWQTALNGEVAEPFMRSGTMHIFAISGLHIALIAGILVSVLRVFHVPRGACGLLVIPLIWFYTGVTGWQASAIRSTIMMTVIIGGWSLKRPSDLLNSLAAAAFIILIWDPQQLFQASFQLSFFVVLSLALFTPVLENIRRRLVQPDPLAPAEWLPRWRRWLGPPLHWLTASFTTSLAAWLGSIPLVAYYFHFFTPVSLLANLLVVPLSSFALMSNLASLMVGGWFPACAVLFNHAAWFFMLWMARISEWAAQLPGGCFNVRAPSTLAFAAYYALLVSVMAGWLARPRVRLWAGSILSILCAAWWIGWQRDRAATRLTILPNAIFLDSPGRKNDWLIDCGNESAAEFITKPFLRAQGVNRLAHFVLTHGEVRRVGGAALIRKYYSPEEIHFSPVRFRSSGYRDFLAVCERASSPTRALQRGVLSGVWKVLHPDREDHFPQADDNTIVLQGVLHGVRVLLLSDLGKPGQNALMERTPDLAAEIVISGIPQQSEPLAGALIDAIRPRLIVITDSEYPATDHASRKLQERLSERNVPLLYTRDFGAVTLTFARGGYQVSTMNTTRHAKTARPIPDESLEPPRTEPEE